MRMHACMYVCVSVCGSIEAVLHHALVVASGSTHLAGHEGGGAPHGGELHAPQLPRNLCAWWWWWWWAERERASESGA